ncbi:MAG: hypothetical protein AAGB00_04065 [Planctomycetota bacterium]
MLIANRKGAADTEVVSDDVPGRPTKILRLEWIGQTVASLCWIGSVLASGVSSTGDWLQLCAASAWLLANVASAMATEPD